MPNVKAHVETVVRVVGDQPLDRDLRHDLIIRESWRRCVDEYRLDPAQCQDAYIVPSHQFREHRDSMEAFLGIARHGLETLYRQVAGMGYVVLLTDARGVTVDFIGDLSVENNLRKAGLYLGADWSEPVAGTCGVGTCISTQQALTVHQLDHFDGTHIPLTCTAAPVYDPSGSLGAVLDISALKSPLPKQSQHLALQLVTNFAHQIENANFLYCFRNDWVIKLNGAPQFLDVNPDYLLALNASGCVIGYNRRFQQLVASELDGAVSALSGARFEELFNASLDDLGGYVHSRPSEQRTIKLAGRGRILFAQCMPPSVAPRSGRSAPLEKDDIPRPLRQLSGGDPALDVQIERAARLANTPVSVLLLGETGTGKEYFAKAIHHASERRNQPFVAINCAAIAESLVESELFGHRPNSFTGAGAHGKKGLIQEADGGTLFLDEIGDMPRDLQARLLRVLAEREVLPVGASQPVPVDVRVIAATHRDLEQAVHDGRFRDDLYYRLNGAVFRMPKLAQRQDLPWLVARVLRLQSSAGESPILAPEARELLYTYDWPGNIRELTNLLQYAAAICTNGYIGVGDLPDYLARLSNRAGNEDHPDDSPDAALLRQYLRAAGWNISAVSRQLRVSRVTLYRRMRRYGIESPNRRDRLSEKKMPRQV